MKPPPKLIKYIQSLIAWNELERHPAFTEDSWEQTSKGKLYKLKISEAQRVLDSGSKTKMKEFCKHIPEGGPLYD